MKEKSKNYKSNHVDSRNREKTCLDCEDENERVSWIPAVFMFSYYLMSILSLVVHLWVTVRGCAEDGIWWGLLYFVCFIYSELYWAYRIFLAEGVTFFVIAASVCSVWWLFLFLFRNKLKSLMSSYDTENSLSGD